LRHRHRRSARVPACRGRRRDRHRLARRPRRRLGPDRARRRGAGQPRSHRAARAHPGDPPARRRHPRPGRRAPRTRVQSRSRRAAIDARRPRTRTGRRGPRAVGALMASADAVLLIAFGGPTRPEEIRPFLENVTRGRRIPADRLEEVAHHYERIGGRSPLNELTFPQAEALPPPPRPPPAYPALRTAGPHPPRPRPPRPPPPAVGRATGVILAPHASESSRERYMETVEAGRSALGPRAPVVSYVGPWHVHPLFIEAVAERVRAARVTLPEDARAGAQLVFTAHSIPVAAPEQSPYVGEIEASARAVAERLGEPSWEIAYQSRSGSPR